MELTRRGFLGAGGVALGAGAFPGALLAAAEQSTPAMPKLDDWDKVRKQFRLTPDYLHFGGFYIASHPEPVRAAIEGFRKALDENPFLTVERGMFESEQSNLQLKVCQDIAPYLGGAPDEIALTPNTTTGLALVYHGLQLKPGDEILCTTHDHFVHHEAIRLACERNGASWRRVPLFNEGKAPEATVEGLLTRIRHEVRPNTRVLGLTWVHSATGIRLPAREIAKTLAQINEHRTGDPVLFVLDGVHGIGAVDEDIADLGCNYFCAGTHKWMFAPRGTGIVWARALKWKELRPTIPSFSSLGVYESWLQGKLPEGPVTAAQVTPGGFLAYEHQWAMGAAFRMHQAMGRARVAARVAELNTQIKEGLAKMSKVKLHTPKDPKLSAGINCFEVDGMKPEAVVAKLLEKKVIASTSPYNPTYARLSAGLMNTPEQVDKALAATRAVIGG